MTPPLRFLHAADLHLDSPLRGLSAYPGAPETRLRLATREAFERLVDTALEHDVAFVILAGDLFDGEWVDLASGLMLQHQLRRLTRVGKPVFMVRGNHDAESRISSKLTWHDGITEFRSKKAHTVKLEEFGVAIHGQSYREPHVLENLALGYPDAVPGMLNIGVLHTGLEGGYEGHGHYAPCSLDDLRAKGYDYWALGHIHQRQIVSEDPWIVFPGNLQGRHVRETGAKGASLVTVAEGRITAVEAVACDVARWDVLSVDLSGADSEEVALARVEEHLRESVSGAEERLVAVRIIVRGVTALDGRFRAQSHRLAHEIRARASAISDDLWVEKVRVETQPSDDHSGGSAMDSDDMLTDLARRIRGAELTDAQLDRLGRDLSKLSAKLPTDVRAVLDPGHPGMLSGTLDDARLYLAALLTTGGEDPEPPDGESAS